MKVMPKSSLTLALSDISSGHWTTHIKSSELAAHRRRRREERLKLTLTMAVSSHENIYVHDIAELGEHWAGLLVEAKVPNVVLIHGHV